MTILGHTHAPLVIHFLVPLTIQCFPSAVFVAVVCKPETSDPAKASDTARQINFFPESTSSTTRSLSAGFAKFITGGRPITQPPCKPSAYPRAFTRVSSWVMMSWWTDQQCLSWVGGYRDIANVPRGSSQTGVMDSHVRMPVWGTRWTAYLFWGNDAAHQFPAFQMLSWAHTHRVNLQFTNPTTQSESTCLEDQVDIRHLVDDVQTWTLPVGFSRLYEIEMDLRGHLLCGQHTCASG